MRHLIEKWRKEASDCDEYDGELLKKAALEGCADELEEWCKGLDSAHRIVFPHCAGCGDSGNDDGSTCWCVPFRRMISWRVAERDEARRMAEHWRDMWNAVALTSKDPHTWYDCGFKLPWEVKK